MSVLHRICYFENIQEFRPYVDVIRYTDRPLNCIIPHLFVVKKSKSDSQLFLRLSGKTYKYFYFNNEKKGGSRYKMKIPKYLRDRLDLFNMSVYTHKRTRDRVVKGYIRQNCLTLFEFECFFPNLTVSKCIAHTDDDHLECSICIERVKPDQDICITKCKHMFHRECLYQWLVYKCPSPMCPMCRTNLRTK